MPAVGLCGGAALYLLWQIGIPTPHDRPRLPAADGRGCRVARPRPSCSRHPCARGARPGKRRVLTKRGVRGDPVPRAPIRVGIPSSWADGRRRRGPASVLMAATFVVAPPLRLLSWALRGMRRPKDRLRGIIHEYGARMMDLGLQSFMCSEFLHDLLGNARGWRGTRAHEPTSAGLQVMALSRQGRLGCLPNP